tara:strand:+ start:2286 stop:2816 length:531 start_codon:yes stop_codon:yes gene_type:complete
MKKVELVILDIDGVLTDGRKYYGTDGMPFAKTYCDKDFTAIKRLRGVGVKVCFLSGDTNINENMAKNRNIDFYAARGRDKAEFIPEFTDVYDTSPDNMLYIGDDLFDLSVMRAVGHAYCPSDAAVKLREWCGEYNTLRAPGGHNVIAEMVEILLSRGLVDDATMEQIEALDKNEKF